MDKDKILDYVMNSPANTNRAVLEGLLEEVNQGSGGQPLVVMLTGDVIEWVNTDTETSDSYVCAYTNITLTQLAEAFDSGKMCKFVYEECEDSSGQYTIEISNRHSYGEDLIYAYTQESAHTPFTDFFYA